MLIRNKKYIGVQIDSPGKVHEIIISVLRRKPRFERDKEHFFVIGLRRDNRIAYIDLVSIGSAHSTIAEVREVFRMAIHKGISSIVLCHNHPSGNCRPSSSDRVLTRKMLDAGKLIGIDVLDHVIVTFDSYYSFNRR